MGLSLARKSRADFRSISCSSLKPKSIRYLFSAVGAPRTAIDRARATKGHRYPRSRCRSRLPEVVVEPAAVVQAPERQLERHVDLDPLRLAVGELQVDPAATLEVDDCVRDGRIGTLEEVVVGEGEERTAPSQAHLREPVRMAALDAHAAFRELHRLAPRAPPAVEREELLPVAEDDHRRR